MEIEGRVALVTGGAVRLGRAIATGLARAGADLVIAYNSSAREAEQVVEEIRGLGRRAVAVGADLATAEGIRTILDAAVRTFDRLDILVNSASRFERAPVPDITEADWDRVLGVNLKAPFFLTQQAAPLLDRESGAVINIADLSALQAWPSFAHHAVSKAGLLHLTRILARALAPRIRVNAVVPGTVLPPAGYQGEDWVGGQDRRVLDRAGNPGDVVDAVLFFLRSDFVTGEHLVVDGGRMLL